MFCAITARADGTPASQGTWTIEDVKKIALEHNPDLKSAKASYEAAAKTVGISISGYLPHLDLNARYEESTLPNPSAGSTGQLGVALPYRAVTASVSQLLFDFGKTLSQIGASRAESNAQEQEAIAVKNAVVLAVQRAFYNAEAADQLVVVARKGLEQFQETFRRTGVLVNTGSRPKFDLTQARVETSKAKLAVINAENARDLARIALLDVMGMKTEETSMENAFALRDTQAVKNISSNKLNLQSLSNKALEARPEMKRQEFSYESARSSLTARIQEYLPTLSLQGWYAKYLPDFPPQIQDSWSVGVYATWHVFQGLETTFRVGEASARVDQQDAELEKERLSIVSEVNRGYRDLVRAEGNLTVADDQLDAAKENDRLAHKRYDAAVATILELLTAETSLLNAEATFVRARYDREIAVATLRRVVNAPLTDDER